MPEYTFYALLACVLVVVWELRFARTGILSTHQFWIAMGIVAFFQVLVDGWLTKLSAPIVTYARSEFSGLRFPFDIPVEDFFFGFALVTLAIVNWVRCQR